MSWVKLDDGFSDHPKIAQVGPFGAWIQLQAFCYANKNLTDGFISFGVARSFMSRCDRLDTNGRVWTFGESSGMQGRDASEVDWPALMVEARLWESVPGGYRIHDYEQYQPSRADVLAKRGHGAARQRGWRARRNAESNGDSDAVSSSVSNRCPVPVPVPLPVPLKKGTTRSLRSLVVTDPPEFAIWWAIYPRKLKKAEARKVWRTLFATEPPPIERMVDAIGWQRQTADWLEHSGKYIPHPDTYLRGRRWDDEPTPTPGAFADPRTSGNAQVLAEVLADIQEGRHA